MSDHDESSNWNKPGAKKSAFEGLDDVTVNHFDITQQLRKRQEKLKDLKLRENRRRKWKSRSAA
jgi:hypothetical protein